jgi:hypothetical protein
MTVVLAMSGEQDTKQDTVTPLRPSGEADCQPGARVA